MKTEQLIPLCRRYHAMLLHSDEQTISIAVVNTPPAELCDGGSNGIPSPTTTRYLSAMSVAKGVVTLTGQESLNGLGVTLTPTWDNAEGVTGWQRVCTITGNSALQQACEDVFRVK